MAKRIKYTKELLEKLVKDSISVSDIIRKLGLKEAGGTHSHIQRKIKEYGIDKSHFLGYAYLRGKISYNRLSWDKILVKNEKGRREDAIRLRRALIESGREYKCEICEQLPTWNNKELRLQVDHKNRDWLDNTPDNLRFVCPNCHSQTEGWCGNKGRSTLTKYTPYKENKNLLGRHQERLKQRKSIRPPLEQLLAEVQELGYCAVGRKYNVTDNAIRKWIRFYKAQVA